MSIDNAVDCCNYINNYVDDMPCRKKILELTEWIFSLDNTPRWDKRGDGFKFFLRIHNKDHFAVFKLRGRKFTHVDFYVGKNNNFISSYLKRISDNPSWATMTGKNFCELSTGVLQEHILNSYHLRLDELGITIDKGSPSSLVMADPITNEENDPTIEEFENFLRSSSQNRKVSIDDAFDIFEQQYTEKTRLLKSGWRKRLEEKLSQSKRI